MDVCILVFYSANKFQMEGGGALLPLNEKGGHENSYATPIFAPITGQF